MAVFSSIRQIAGEDAAEWNVIRLDNLSTVNQGMLLEANLDSGRVSWRDKTGEAKTVELPAHMLRLVSVKW